MTQKTMTTVQSQPENIKDDPKATQKHLKSVFKSLENAIKKYFDECDGELAIDEESGMPLTGHSGGYIYKILPTPPTLSGLAIATGFLSKKELIEKARETQFDKYGKALKLAISRIEEYAERELIKSGATGVKLFLSANFEGWSNEDTKASKATASQTLSAASTEALKRFLETTNL